MNPDWSHPCWLKTTLGQYKKCVLWVILTYSTYFYFEFNVVRSIRELFRALVHVRNCGYLYRQTIVVPNCCDSSIHAYHMQFCYYPY